MNLPKSQQQQPQEEQTRVVNLFQEDYDVYIGRKGFGMDGYFGNPFRLNKDGTRMEILDKYRKYFNNRINSDQEFAQKIKDLKGLVLGCFCKPRPCHGDIVVAYLNRIATDED